MSGGGDWGSTTMVQLAGGGRCPDGDRPQADPGEDGQAEVAAGDPPATPAARTTFGKRWAAQWRFRTGCGTPAGNAISPRKPSLSPASPGRESSPGRTPIGTLLPWFAAYSQRMDAGLEHPEDQAERESPSITSTGHATDAEASQGPSLRQQCYQPSPMSRKRCRTSSRSQTNTLPSRFPPRPGQASHPALD
jgi:hypothetical protein